MAITLTSVATPASHAIRVDEEANFDVSTLFAADAAVKARLWYSVVKGASFLYVDDANLLRGAFLAEGDHPVIIGALDTLTGEKRLSREFDIDIGPRRNLPVAAPVLSIESSPLEDFAVVTWAPVSGAATWEYSVDTGAWTEISERSVRISGIVRPQSTRLRVRGKNGDGVGPVADATYFFPTTISIVDRTNRPTLSASVLVGVSPTVDGGPSPTPWGGELGNTRRNSLYSGYASIDASLNWVYGVSSSTVDVEWNDSTNAVDYEVEASESISFSNSRSYIFRSSDKSESILWRNATSISPRSLYIRVRAIGYSPRVVGPWSNVAGVTIGQSSVPFTNPVFRRPGHTEGILNAGNLADIPDGYCLTTFVGGNQYDAFRGNLLIAGRPAGDESRFYAYYAPGAEMALWRPVGVFGARYIWGARLSDQFRRDRLESSRTPIILP